MKVLLMLVACCANVAMGQVITVIQEAPVARGVAGPRPVSGSLAVLDVAAGSALFATAPQEQLGRDLREYGLHLSIPTPTGELEECVLAESSVMAPELQGKYPQIRSFIVQSTEHPEISGRFEISQRGLTAMLRTSRGAWFIDPWQSMDAAHVVSYYMSDLPGGNDWKCETPVESGVVKEEGDVVLPQVLGTLRSYRMAMACTGEYGAYHCQIQGHAPNTADPLAAIVTLVSRSNVVYEADMAIRFTLVANNDLLVFLDGATDPYPSTCGGGGGTDCSGAVLGENAGVINGAIGSANYDIGHCVTRIFGGVANLRAVCTNNKAGGVSGIPRGGDVDPFSALVVIHEIGHQFGANHTFSGIRGRCAGNVNLNTAWEAGTGSSPMGYAGGCPVGDAPPSDNIQLFADPFFHHGSVLEMQAFLATGGHTCPVLTTTTNNAPLIVSTTPASKVPPGTPFRLSVDASDQDNNTLTYSWEQFDNGVARPISGEGVSDNGSGALFRIFPPVLSNQRTFPKMADVLSGVATPGEMLPTTTGVTRRFRVLVRDNAPGAGGIAVSSFVNVEIPNATSPFVVLAPIAGAVRRSGASSLVAWNVGNTNVAPISATNVLVKLSLDGGVSFPIVLSSLPNTGLATVTLPSVSSLSARIMIEAQGHIFFAVSRPFVIETLCQAVDFNDDGIVDFFDYLDFVDTFSGGWVGSDFNLDGVVDFFDYLDFVDAFASAC